MGEGQNAGYKILIGMYTASTVIGPSPRPKVGEAVKQEIICGALSGKMTFFYFKTDFIREKAEVQMLVDLQEDHSSLSYNSEGMHREKLPSDIDCFISSPWMQSHAAYCPWHSRCSSIFIQADSLNAHILYHNSFRCRLQRVSNSEKLKRRPE